METSLLSVGIDIGTSTTSMVASRLRVQNMAPCFSAPRVAITGQEIVYRGGIHPTPIQDDDLINIQAVAAIIRDEYRAAGIRQEEVQTGAVIITGESSRKQNAALVTQQMSGLAGEFVVAAAGPDLESAIAGKGSGAERYSREHSCTVANLDIGGGTTNIAVFHCGGLLTVGCWDIGGRLIRVKGGRVCAVSPAAEVVADSLGVALRVGGQADERLLCAVTDRMAGVLCEAVGSAPATPLMEAIRTGRSSIPALDRAVDAVFFSGGVAEYIYHPATDCFRHGDIGILLADSVRKSPLYRDCKVERPEETIRATVIGAGAHTTTVSGSTIFFSAPGLLPRKNLPVFAPGAGEEEQAVQGDGSGLRERAAWFLEESASENLLFHFARHTAMRYRQICGLAEGLAEAAGALPDSEPLFVLCGGDYAKSLGQALTRRMGAARPVVCVDGFVAGDGDYVDFGVPLLEGVAVPVVVKTLLFG